MKKFSLIILESDIAVLNKLTEYFSACEDVELIGSSDSGSEGLKLIKEFSPDAVLSGLFLKDLDGLGMVEKAKKEGLNSIFIMTGACSEDEIIKSVMKSGAKFYILKPFEPSAALKRIEECLERGEVEIKGIEEEISSIFISIGIPPHIKGYRYLREGIKMTVKSPSIINSVTKELYPKIGEKFSTSASKVERAIRHAIEVAWNRGRIDAINSVFGSHVYIGTEKPTNSEFIALVADKLILKNF